MSWFSRGSSSIWGCWILWREENRRTRRKTSSGHGENQQQTHYTGIKPWSHWWEASALTSASSLLPGQEVPQYNLNTQVILGLRFQFGRPRGWSQLVTVTQTATFYCAVWWVVSYCPCITRIFNSIWFGTALSTVFNSTRWRPRATKRYSSFSLIPTPQCSIPVCNLVGDRELEKIILAKVPLLFGVFRVFGLPWLPFIRHIAFRNYRAGART